MSTVRGTPLFNSPEMSDDTRDKAHVKAPTDVFSLGLVFSVLWKFNEQNQCYIPQPISTAADGTVQSYALKLLNCKRAKEPLPELVEEREGCNGVEQSLVYVIREMTNIESDKRITCDRLEEKLTDLKTCLEAENMTDMRTENVETVPMQPTTSAVLITQDLQRDSIEFCDDKFYVEKKVEQDVYWVQHDLSMKRGFAVIVNITKDREGALIDENSMKHLFQQLNYEVRIIKDKTKEDIMKSLKKISKDKQLDDHDSIVIFLMAHGQKDEIFDVDGFPMCERELFQIFENKRCTLLNGKPKLFFFQACRGVRQENHIKGEDQRAQEEKDEMDNGSRSIISRPSDLFIAYATVAGHAAYRDPHSGSRYPKAIWDVFRKQAKNCHVAGLLTKVNKNMHENLVSFKLDNTKTKMQAPVQCAECVTTLRKEFYFFPRQLVPNIQGDTTLFEDAEQVVTDAPGITVPEDMEVCIETTQLLESNLLGKLTTGTMAASMEVQNSNEMETVTPATQSRLNNLSASSNVKDQCRKRAEHGHDGTDGAPQEKYYRDDNGTTTNMENQTRSNVGYKELALYPFQVELAEPCYSGANRLIFAPTNSGKTIVAVAIAKNHLETGPKGKRKVIFIVPKVCLAEQQLNRFQTYMPQRFHCTYVVGQGENTPDKTSVDTLLKTFDVIVMTPQILLDALNSKEVNFNKMTIILFDECHLTQKNNPYNGIMKQYIHEKIKLDNRNLPQIVGFTASVGTGKLTRINNTEAALEHIIKLCANLDSLIHCVRKEKSSLDKHISKPIIETEHLMQREADPFRDLIVEMMHVIENKVRLLTEQEVQFPDVGTQAYTQELSTLENRQNNRDQRGYTSCLQYLQIYNDAVLLNEDCEAMDALDLIKNNIDNKQGLAEGANTDQQDYELYHMFKDKEDSLKQIGQRDKNPKLQRLKGAILRKLAKTPEACGLVMVSTRVMTIAIERFLRDDFDIQTEKLTVERFVGSGASRNDYGMTKGEWNKTKRKLDDGEIRIVVSTNVLEMGLDLPACSLVINYERIQNVESQIQLTGRARAANALVITLTQSSKIIIKDAVNTQKVKIMYEAVDRVCQMSPDELQERIEQKQRSVVEKQQPSLQGEQSDTVHKDFADSYQFLCYKCLVVVCHASSVRLFKFAHHVVTDPAILEKFDNVKPNKGREFGIIVDGTKPICKMGKIRCKNCFNDWGTRWVHKESNTVVPILKKGCFRLQRTDDTEQQNLILLKEWKTAPFDFLGIGIDDILTSCGKQST